MTTLLVILASLFFGFPTQRNEESPTPAYLCAFVAPEYSPVARQARASGFVHVAAHVNTDGIVSSVAVIDGNALLSESAVEAVKQWRFCSSGSTPEQNLTITVMYKLEGKGTNNWKPTDVRFHSPTEVTVITAPPEEPGTPDYWKKP